MSSLSSGLNASISGLKNYGYRVSVNAGNVAKADAVSAKETEVFVVGVNTSSSVSNFTPGGVASTVYQHMTAVGDTNPSQVETFMAIGGQGFFVVSDSSTGTAKDEFTRIGTFAPDKNGDLKNTAGRYLKVWPTNSVGDVVATDTVTTAGLVVASTKNLTGAPVASSNVNMNLVLPSAKNVGYTFNVPRQVIDSLGVSHQVTFNWQKTQAVPEQWTITAASPDATAIGAPYDTGMVVEFDAQGNPASINNATVAPPANNAPAVAITWNSPAAVSTLTMFMGTIGNPDGVRAFGDIVNTNAVKVDGRVTGRLEGISIEDKSGLIYAKYDNGASVPFAKIPLALFNNPNALLESNGGIYTPTSDSGSYQLTVSGQNGAGGILSSKTEASTIDSTEQFTRIIVDQTNYQSNAKVISVINEMQKSITQMI